MDASIIADQQRAVSDVVTAAGETVLIAGHELLAIVGTQSSYLYADRGYAEAGVLEITVASRDLPTDALAGETAQVRGVDYIIAENPQNDGAVATLTLR